MLEKEHALTARQGFITYQSKQLSCKGDATHDRQMIFSLEHFEDGRLATWRVGPDHSRQQVEARFVNKDKLAPLLAGLFFNSGQTSVRHASIWASSRWVARSIGFWGVHSTSFINRETCDLEYDTPNSHSMILAMRAHVKTSPRKPYASAPCDRNSGIRRSCASVSLGGAPVWGRARRASGPSSRTAANHWLTAGRETPNAFAIRNCAQPTCESSKARCRRTSFQSSGYAEMFAIPNV